MGERKHRWTCERVLQHAAVLYGGQLADASERRRVDRELQGFQRCDAAAPIALELLATISTWSSALGAAGPSIALLLAQTLRRQSRKGRLPRAATMEEAEQRTFGDQLLTLAEALHAYDRRIAEALAFAAAACWLHAGIVPVDQLLSRLAEPTVEADGGGSHHGLAPRCTVTLLVLQALPEEVTAPEVSLGTARSEVILALAGAAPRVLSAILGLVEVPAVSRFAVASPWLSLLEGTEVVDALSTSPLVGFALQAAAADDSCRSPACDFLDALLKKSIAAPANAMVLVEQVLRLLAVAQPSTPPARRAVSKFVADAVVAWCPLFVSKGGPPAPPWQQLIEYLRSCAEWGVEPAFVGLPAWVALNGAAAKVDASPIYGPLFARGLRVLRSATRYPLDFATWSEMDQEVFRDFRTAFRDAARRLVEKDAMANFIAEVCSDCRGSAGGPWVVTEETLHALSAVAGSVCQRCTVDAPEPALKVLDLFHALSKNASSFFFGHRQLLCTYLVCASVYGPVLALPLRKPEVGQGKALVLAQVLDVARQSLGVPQDVDDAEHRAFPFRAKQDHAGVVCILKLCMTCGQELAAGSTEVLNALRKVLAEQVQAILTNAPQALNTSSLLVLAQALAMIARHNETLTQDVLGDCLAGVGRAAASGRSDVVLAAAAEVVVGCKGQGIAVASAMDAAWPALSCACCALDPKPLGRLLAAAAETDGFPACSLRTLASFVAQTSERRPDARAALFDPVVALACKPVLEAEGTALVRDLATGLGQLAWAALDCDGRLKRRLPLLVDATVRRADAEQDMGCDAWLAPRERRLLEAWARCVREVGHHAPHCLEAGVVQQVLHAAAAALAVPHTEPPVRTLALLSEGWADAALQERWRAALHTALLLPEAWPLGALVLRGLVKALLGQMPVSSAGVLVPAVRGMMDIGGNSFAGWLSRAVDGEDFPGPASTTLMKGRFVKELVAARENTTHFKQVLKRFCSG